MLTSFKLRSWNFLPCNDATLRQLLYTAATGDTSVPMHWFAALTSESAAADNSIHDVQQAVQSTSDDEPAVDDTSSVKATRSSAIAVIADRTALHAEVRSAKTTTV